MTIETARGMVRGFVLALLAAVLLPQAYSQDAGGRKAKPPKAGANVAAAREVPAAVPADLPENVKQYMEKLGQIQRNPGGVQESVVLEVLKTAQEVGQPFAASLAVNQYLSQHLDTSPEVLLLAARNAAAGGDLRMAVTRYKNYLKQVRTGEDASDAAAELFAIQIDFLGAGDDAYRVMTEQGEPLRGSVKGRKFDSWYLDMARNQKDYVGHARRLAMIMSDRASPVELERMICWHHLDWLCSEMGTAKEQQIRALSTFETLASLVREDAGRAKRVAFVAAALTFESRGQTVDPEARKNNFRKVLEAAKAYVDAAPTAATVMDIYAVFGGGWATFDFGRLPMDGELKGEALVYAFPKLSEAERQALFAWQVQGRRMVEIMAAGSAWNKLAETVPDWFKGRQAAAGLPFDVTSGTREDFQARAAALAGVAAPKAAVIGAIAAGAKLTEAVDHFAAKESWGISFQDFYGTVSGDLLKGWCKANGVNAAQVDGMRPEAMAHLFRNHAIRTPIVLFDRDGTRTALFQTWQYLIGEGRDPAEMASVLRSLDWAPIEGRGDVFGGVRAEFNRWAAEAKRTNKQADLAKVPALQEAFNAAAGLNEPRLDAAPNAVCRKAAEVLLAIRKGSGEEVTARGTELYGVVKNYRQDKTPLGGAIVQFLAGLSAPKIEPFDLQFKIIADQLANYKPETDAEMFGATMNAMMASRRWGWANVPGQDRERAMKVSGEIAKALVRLMDQGTYSRQLFDLMRGTARGNGWADTSASDAALERTIVERGRGANAAVRAALRPWELMHVVRHEYQSLNAKYPFDKYFDDMVAADMKATKALDYQYWDYAQDTEKKVSDAAAAVLQGFTRLPLGYGGGPAMALGVFQQWQARAMDAKPAARDAMLKAVEAVYGQTRFDPLAMGSGYFEKQASVANPAKRQEFVQRLKAYLDRAAAAPYRVPPPSMVALADLKALDSLTPEEADQMARIFSTAAPEMWARDRQFDRLVLAMEASLIAQKKDATLASLVPHFWKVAKDTASADLERSLVRSAKTLLDRWGQQLAASYCLGAQEIMGGKMAEENRQILSGVRTRALANLVRNIPVDKTDRRYPAYEAQMAYLTDRFDEAWEKVESHGELIAQLYRDLDPQFCIWIIRKYTQTKRFKEAEDLARPMILWMDQNIKGFDPEMRGSLYVAYADLSLARKSYPEARAQFERIAATVDLENTVAQRLAEIRIGEVDRLTKNYDKAIEWLEKLAKKQDKFTRVEANYQLAMVKYDQAQPKNPTDLPDRGLLKEALQYVEAIFNTNPGHQEGNILWGKINLGIKKYDEAKSLDGLSVNEDQRILIPGRALTVHLNDRNLSIVGRATEVQVAVWTKSGDREVITLLPSGDTATKFEGTILSQMAPISSSNGLLEVYGGDEVYYDFTKEFRDRAKITAAAVTNVITVASDAELYASSGAIVDKAELEKRALEQKIKESIAKRAKTQVREEKAVEEVALSTLRSLDQVKPGNPINVRVVDHDHNVSPQKDTLAVRVKATSGDKIDNVVLTETDAHTGVFEGVIKTDSSEAVAYATDSEEGKDPNFVISSGEHPAWTAEPNNVRPKTFSVDMYDNVALNELSILANVAGRKLKKFILQTSLNGKDFTSVGSVPAMFEGWDGSPRFQVARFAPPEPRPGQTQAAAIQPPIEAGAMRDYLESGFAISGVPMAYGRHANFNIAWDENVGGVGGRLGFGNDQGQGWYVARFVGGFYLPTRETRSFELTSSFTVPEGVRAGGAVIALLDGQAFAAPQGAAARGADPSAPVTAAVTKQLGKGVHKIEVFVCAQRNMKPTFDLKIDSDQPPYIKPCPAEMFDTKASPEIAAELSSKPVDIAVDQDGSRFTTKFDEKANARILRMIMLDYETDAPSINRIQLSNRDGKQVLPTRQDLIALRKNDILEIVPGDRVTVTYQDPVVVSREKDVHQAFLTATFINAQLSASFLEVAYQGTEAVETYVPLRRFAAGDVVTVFINDPDCDTSAAPDKVTFTMELFGKKPVTMEALETKEHSGTFICRMFPVTNAATKASEVQIVEGDDILLSYMDRENTDPGIPWKRTYVVEQVWYQTPEMRVFDVFSQDLATNAPGAAAAKAKPVEKSGDDKAKAGEKGSDDKVKIASRLKAKAPAAGAAESGGGGDGAAAGTGDETLEKFIAQREMVMKRPILPDYAKPASILINGSLISEIMFPTIVKSPLSTTEVFIQTKTGRKKAGLIKEDKPAAVEIKTDAAAPAAATPPADAAATPPAPPAPAAVDAAKAAAAGEEVKPMEAADAAKPAEPAKAAEEAKPAAEAPKAAEAAKPAAEAPKAEAAKPAAEPAKTDQKAEATTLATDTKVETTFDVNVPGTIKRVLRPGGAGAFAAPPGYTAVRLVQQDLKDTDEVQMRRLRKYQTLTDPLGAGIFTLVIPLQLGDIPDTAALEPDPNSGQWPPLYVHGDDDIYIGYRYADDKGVTNWLVQTVKLDGDKFFDVMDRSYEEKIESAYVGETLYFRVLDQMRDVSPEKDEIKLEVKTSSGGSQKVTLVETLKHTGVFKGAVKLTYAADGVKTQDSAFAAFAVKYGDTMNMAYARPPKNESPIEHEVAIHKGADGSILPFSKKFKDQDVAVQTQFTLAEAFFELAKRHRKMGQQDLARKEIAHGKRLLEEAIRDFPEVEFRVQADYLLANLNLEFANDAVNQDLAKQYLLEAANKFADIVAKNPESPYAPKSQYKKGLVYEKMGEIDQAAEEYVKLSYKYPDNELVAETIARLGQYFLTKGTNQLALAKLEKNAIENEKKRLEALETFTTAGQVLGRLAARFPAHQLAGKTQVLSGQCYMRAEKYLDAARAFEIVIKKPDNHSPDLVAEAMFWCGESYMKMLDETTGAGARAPVGRNAVNPMMAAYKMYK